MSRDDGLRDAIEAVRSRFDDCDGVANALGLQRGSSHRRRRRYWTCPGRSCEGKGKPTLSTPPRGGWCCFRCGEKGDAFALVGLSQGFSLPLRGQDFIDVLTWLAAQAGVTLPPPSRPDPFGGVPITVQPVDPNEAEQRPAPAVVAAAWKALEARQVDDSAAARWLEGRGICARYVASGFAVLDRPAVVDLVDAPSVAWLRGVVGAAIVAPLRSLVSGTVGALQARAFAPVDEGSKRRTVGRLEDEDGTPRVFGEPDMARNARVVVLVEGLADTWAAEALVVDGRGVAVIGAVNAGALPDVAEWLLSGTTARVVIVRHLDGMDSDGAGQTAADEAAAILGSRGQHFAWPTFRRALLALGVDTRPTPPGFDLAAATALARDVFDDAADAFLSAIGEVAWTYGLAKPQTTDTASIAADLVEISDWKYGAPNDD